MKTLKHGLFTLIIFHFSVGSSAVGPRRLIKVTLVIANVF